MSYIYRESVCKGCGKKLQTGDVCVNTTHNKYHVKCFESKKK